MRKSLLLKLIPSYIVIIGLLAAVLYSQISLPNSANIIPSWVISKASAEEKHEFVEGVPTRVYIPATGADVSVVDGNYEETTDSWNVSNTQAQFASITKQSNNKEGLTFIYAHDTNSLFGSIKDLNPGDIVYVETSNGRLFEYKYESKQEVKPDNVEIFNYEGDPQLTLATCSGLFNEKRTLVHFDLISVR